MQQLQNLEPFLWINERTDNFSQVERSAYVSHSIPKGYQAYCKICHPMFEDLSIQDRSLTQIAAEKRGISGASSRDKRILWSELAERYQVAVHPEFSLYSFSDWFNYIVYPDDGQLDESACIELAKILSSFIQRQSYYLCHAFETLTGKVPSLLFVGSLEEVLNPLTFVHETPTPSYYWWAEDQSWCVNTDWDLSFTLVGGAEKLIEALLSSSVLECIQVTEFTRIDRWADRVNSTVRDH